MGFFDNNRLLDLLSNYLKTQFELVKLDIQEALEALLIKLFKFIFAALALCIAFLFILMALANFLNDYLQSTYLGYLLVGVVSLLVGLILFRTFQAQETFPQSEVKIEPTDFPSDNHEEESE